ncbi:MAG: response regulator [Actinomyces sp.]|nr:MAG: response regulator [Actinomyces sp.]
MSAPAESEGRPVTVVVAEDESIIRLDLVETLRAEGYEVLGDVGAGDEAVALVEELAPDVVLLDIKMPGVDGLAAARRITEGRRTAVVVLTAFSQRDLVEEAREAGAMAYLVKPYQRDDLVPAIELALARFREFRALEEQVDDLEQRFETRKLVDRAKGRLMDEHGLSEADAFRFVQRTAMSTRRPMREVAVDVIEGRLAP